MRLTKVDQTIDPLTGRPIVEIEWAEEDALTFPLCISSVDQECRLVEDVSVARGNVVLVDHGERFEESLDEPVPGEMIPPDCEDPCCPSESLKTRRYRPTLPRPEITYSQPLPPCVSMTRNCKLVSALPQATLNGFPALPDGSPAFGSSDILDPEPLG